MSGKPLALAVGVARAVRGYREKVCTVHSCTLYCSPQARKPVLERGAPPPSPCMLAAPGRAPCNARASAKM